MELMVEAIRNMTAIEDINLDSMGCNDDNASEMLMEALVANQALNPSLKKINLRYAGKIEFNFKAPINALRAKGVEILSKYCLENDSN